MIIIRVYLSKNILQAGVTNLTFNQLVIFHFKLLDLDQIWAIVDKNSSVSGLNASLDLHRCKNKFLLDICVYSVLGPKAVF